MHWKPLISGKDLIRGMSGMTSGVIGILGAALIALPANAANLQFWRFDQQQNRLTFTTDTQVRPTAQLIFNPTRLVIDLPGTQITSSTTRQRLQEGLQEVRVGQLDEQTARIVIELAPGYTLDPQKVQVQGETSRRWFVQLPDLVATDGERGSQPPVAERPAERSENQVSEEFSDQTPNQVVDAGGSEGSAQRQNTQVRSIVATADGFFVRVSGDTPEVRIRRSRRRDPQRTITLELSDSSIAPGLTSSSLPNNRYSVASWEVSQQDSTVLITMTLADGSPDWRTISTEIGNSFRGISVLPDGMAIRDIPDTAPSAEIPVPSEPIANLPSREPRPEETPRPRPAQRPPARRPQPSQERVVVAIDPGHGGRDPGAVGIGGLQEKQVIFPIAQQVAAILREQGVEVVMTRNSDIELDLDPRVQIAERASADLFVSIHANAINLSRPDVNGLETYYYSNAGASFARTVHDVVLNTMGMSDRRVRQARFYVLRRTSMPAILIEVGFVTGAEDIHNLRDPEWRSRMADAIARGILAHIQRGF